jgi:hypothetical protein
MLKGIGSYSWPYSTFNEVVAVVTVVDIVLMNLNTQKVKQSSKKNIWRNQITKIPL